MNGLDDLPASVYRAIFLGIVFYFALLLYAGGTGSALARFGAEFVFGVIAVGVGTVLFLQARGNDSGSADGKWPILAAAVCLVIGGALQFAFLFTRVPSLDQLSSLLVFAGIGSYIYASWYSGE